MNISKFRIQIEIHLSFIPFNVKEKKKSSTTFLYNITILYFRGIVKFIALQQFVRELCAT